MPRILYKYLDIVGAKCMIGNQNLQFTNASQLNDPFDCHPKLIDYSNVPNTKLQGWIPKEWWIEKEENDALNLRNDTWLCSLSKINDSLLMWSHYCYNHKGICIGLDIDKVLESVPPMFGTIYLEPLVLDVQYQDIIERPNAYHTTKDLFSYQWQTKAKEWEYEQEVRLVIPKPSPIYAAFTPQQAKLTKEIWDWREIRHYMPLKGECFESIYFGVNIDEQEKEKIIQFVRKKLNPHINLYQMRVYADAFRIQPEFIKPLNSDLAKCISEIGIVAIIRNYPNSLLKYWRLVIIYKCRITFSYNFSSHFASLPSPSQISSTSSDRLLPPRLVGDRPS